MTAVYALCTERPTECERLQGFPDGWTDLGGTPDSKRYAALGDAVTVNVAHWIGARIASAYQSAPSTDGAFPDPAVAGRSGKEPT